MTFEEAKNQPIREEDLDNPQSNAYLAIKAAAIAIVTVKETLNKMRNMYVDAVDSVDKYGIFGEWYEKKLLPMEDEIYGIERAVSKAIEKWRNENDID